MSKNEKIIIASSGLVVAGLAFLLEVGPKSSIYAHIIFPFLGLIVGIFGGTVFCLAGKIERLKEKKSTKKQTVYYAAAAVLMGYALFFPDITDFEWISDLLFLAGLVSFGVAALGCKATE